MSDISAGLLPEGFRDRLPPQAAAAARLLRGLLDHVEAHGYERVAPPLVEYEATLVSRLSADGPQDLLRFIDPLSQRTLALRPDMTAQVGRIAVTRMAQRARPLRLCYGGQVARLKGTQLSPEREATQAGAELIGSDAVPAVTEVLLLAVETLAGMGASGLSVDLTMPGLVAELAATYWPVDDCAAIAHLLDAKDVGGLRQAGGAAYEPLIAAAGPAEQALERLRALNFPPGIAGQLQAIAALVAAVAPVVTVTLDPTERHSFTYQSWVGFSIYAAGARGEVGRGGSYAIRGPGETLERAVGFSLYVDALVDQGFGIEQRPRLFLPLGTPVETGARLRHDGFATVAALDASDTAQALRCTHAWDGTRAQPIDGDMD